MLKFNSENNRRFLLQSRLCRSYSASKRTLRSSCGSIKCVAPIAGEGPEAAGLAHHERVSLREELRRGCDLLRQVS
jgi:hypothetical protein